MFQRGVGELGKNRGPLSPHLDHARLHGRSIHAVLGDGASDGPSDLLRRLPVILGRDTRFTVQAIVAGCAVSSSVASPIA